MKIQRRRKMSELEREFCGFEGAMIGTETDSSARVAGLAFWQTAESFDRSVPSNPDYEIKLYSLYR